MRIDQVRISEMLKAYEKGRAGGSRRQGQGPDRLNVIRDEVIISTEAKRLMIRDQVVGQVAEKLRNLLLPASSLREQASHNTLPEVDVILEEAARDSGLVPLDSEEKARILERGLDTGRGERAAR